MSEARENLPKEGLAVIWLKEDSDFEYHGDPVIVNCYETKLKTTVDPIRIGRDDVLSWEPLSANKERTE